MNILFTDLIGNMKPAFNTQLEIVRNCIKDGDNVFMLRCNESFDDGCICAKPINKRKCLFCKLNREISVRNAGIQDMLQNIDIVLDDNAKFEWDNSGTYHDIEEIKKLQFESMDLGYGLASEIISFSRDPKPIIDEKTNFRVNKQIREMEKYKIFLEHILKEKSIDKVYIFNGRYSLAKLAFRVVKSMGIDVDTFEKNLTLDKYMIYRGALTHDLEYTKRQIEVLWASNNDFKEKQRVAQEWLDNRMDFQNKIGFNINQNQDAKISFDHNKINIGIFLSSEDEREAVGDSWKPKLFRNQTEGLKWILSKAEFGKAIHFYLRVHPNLKNLTNEQTAFTQSIQSNMMTVFSPTDPMPSYKLMRECDAVLVFGSTVGLEACYKRKKVILIGRAWYEGLGGMLAPQTENELYNCLIDFNANTWDLDEEYLSAIKYGYFMATKGEKFKYYKKEIYFDRGKGKGQVTPLEHKGIWGIMDIAMQSFYNKYVWGSSSRE